MENAIDILVDYETYDFIVADAQKKSDKAISTGVESSSEYDHTKITYLSNGKIIIECFSFVCPVIQTTVDELIQSIIENVSKKGKKLKIEPIQ